MHQLQFSATTHRFHDASISKVVQHAQFGNFFHHMQVNMERNNAGSWSKMIDSYLQQVIVGEVSEVPRVMRVEAAREARVGTAEHGLHLVLVSDHDDGAVFPGRSRHLLDNSVQHLSEVQHKVTS